jgi:hypothetical protein
MNVVTITSSCSTASELAERLASLPGGARVIGPNDDGDFVVKAEAPEALVLELSQGEGI